MKIYEIANMSNQVVYHCTRYENAENILKHDYFRATRGQELTGLSTTTDENYFWGGREVRFILDLAKLKKTYSIKKAKLNVHDSDGKFVDESELVVVSDTPIIDAHQFIISIECTIGDGSSYQKFLKALDEYCSKFDTKTRKI